MEIDRAVVEDAVDALELLSVGIRMRYDLKAELRKLDKTAGNLRAALDAAPTEPNTAPLADLIAAKTAEIEAVIGDPWPLASINERRYQRLQILGAAPGGSKELEHGTVLRFQSLDAFIDADIAAHPDRGEPNTATPTATFSPLPSQEGIGREAAVVPSDSLTDEECCQLAKDFSGLISPNIASPELCFLRGIRVAEKKLREKRAQISESQQPAPSMEQALSDAAELITPEVVEYEKQRGTLIPAKIAELENDTVINDYIKIVQTFQTDLATVTAQRDELEMLAKSRLEQMQADRKQYLDLKAQRDELLAAVCRSASADF